MKIYIAMHKMVNVSIKNDLYIPLLVGSFNKNDSKILRDDQGENISNKNINYCELTGLYWIWKNSREDIVGLCHYRRFLSKKALSIGEKYYFTKSDLYKIFYKQSVDIILPKRHYFSGKILSENSIAPNEEDMAVIRKILQEKYEDYLVNYDSVMNGNSAYLYNIMIAKKNIFDKYCEWLFDILFESEQRIDKNTYVNDPYRKRLFGFISERLLNVWIAHNRKNLNLVEFPLINTEIKLKQRVKSLSIQHIRKILALVYGKTKICCNELKG